MLPSSQTGDSLLPVSLLFRMQPLFHSEALSPVKWSPPDSYSLGVHIKNQEMG